MTPDAALLRSCEGGITPVEPPLARAEMGMAFWSFAGSKVTNLNLYRRSKERRGHVAAPSPSPHSVQGFLIREDTSAAAPSYRRAHLLL